MDGSSRETNAMMENRTRWTCFIGLECFMFSIERKWRCNNEIQPNNLAASCKLDLPVKLLHVQWNLLNNYP